MEANRLVPRFKKIPFQFFSSDRSSFTLTADDASNRCARFGKHEEQEVSRATGGCFKLNRRTLTIKNMRLPPSLQRPDACILEYDASVENLRESLRRFLNRLRGVLIPVKARDEARERYRKPGFLKRFLLLLLPGRVSRIHLYEAQERYVYLQRTLDYYEKVPKAPEDYPEGPEVAKASIRICRQALDSASVLLTRRQHDLNFLWREMTQVHIILLEKVLPDRALASHLDFCCEEMHRMAATKDPEISQRVQRIAELKDAKGENRTEMVRLLRALIERFTTIRTGRMHEQFVNIRSYQKALLLLLPIATLLIVNADLVLNIPKGPPLPALDLPISSGFLGLGVIWSLAIHVLNVVRHLLTYNLIAFVFFAGLLGGFFSVTVRLRTRELTPGEDAYFAWYVLTKPVIGALGAAVLFILMQAGFVTFDFGPNLADALRGDELGPTVFGFAFLAGFSERLIFPALR